VNRRFGLAALTVLELPPAEQVSVAAAAGYDDVGLRLIPVAGQPVVHAINVAEIEARLAATGLRVLDVEVFRVSAETKVADYERAMADAQRLGAGHLLAHGADADASRLADNFGRLCDLASAYGLSVNIEPMPWVDVSTVAQAKQLLAAIGRSNAALLVDPIHFFRADNRFEDLRGAVFNYLQFCDARAERPADRKELIRQAREDRMLPGEGGLDLAGLMRALPADLPISLEMPLARKLEPAARARLVLESTRKFLEPGAVRPAARQ
jgi:sugar phosphate isomerase/epimerase